MLRILKFFLRNFVQIKSFELVGAFGPLLPITATRNKSLEEVRKSSRLENEFIRKRDKSSHHIKSEEKPKKYNKGTVCSGRFCKQVTNPYIKKMKDFITENGIADLNSFQLHLIFRKHILYYNQLIEAFTQDKNE
jgi:hypothetical protein